MQVEIATGKHLSRADLVSHVLTGNDHVEFQKVSSQYSIFDYCDRNLPPPWQPHKPLYGPYLRGVPGPGSRKHKKDIESRRAQGTSTGFHVRYSNSFLNDISIKSCIHGAVYVPSINSVCLSSTFSVPVTISPDPILPTKSKRSQLFFKNPIAGSYPQCLPIHDVLQTLRYTFQRP